MRRCCTSPSTGPTRSCRGTHTLQALLLGLLLACSPLSSALAQDTLRDQWGAIVALSPFAQPVHVSSEERRYSVSGSVHARVAHPFDRLATALDTAAAWCEILFLHPNVKACLPDDSAAAGALQLYVGRLEESIAEAERLDLLLRTTALSDNYMAIRLEGARGPYAMRDFLLHLQAIPDDAVHSLISLRYSLAFGTTARLALRAYFAFGGRNRVGFTVESQGPDGQPQYVGGLPGMIERNVMHFYLGLSVHLDTLKVPEPERFAERLAAYFAAIDRYPRQLREQDEASYLAQKRQEHVDQQAYEVSRP
ncbi:hypothetical protein [Billgrantia kenyensis]|uniref:Uncharacterized protein n=1 Tax=Billgrantia kenyensis TaxID=321266 RepID=A0A7W0AF50_9GAMM|nr:hypothetical protein [Halomonas kenyensis]MBA2779981.1 hypothetical protein [Halomonas kenyensis]MCG6663004.1 hypothetical protein [Halomonas kenyensis]